MNKKDRIQKQRVVTWEKRDKAGNDTAFALVDFRAPESCEAEVELWVTERDAS